MKDKKIESGNFNDVLRQQQHIPIRKKSVKKPKRGCTENAIL